MNQMKLVDLELKNFKGTKSFTLEANGENVQLFGDNATGKTTVFDAFIWLLFDKDSNNKSDFAIKTLDDNNNIIHGLDHEVEGTFLLNDKTITLRKVYSEKWTKKRGSAKEEFTGHTTDYFINGVPVKKSEYKERIDSIVDEDAFKLLTSPSYFNEQLHWEKRRKILLEVCGDITDQDVITSNKKLAKLPEILSDRTIEEQKKIIASKRSHINKELDKIPVRIDEINHNLPDISGLDESKIMSEIEDYKLLIQDKESEANRIRNGGQVAELQKELRVIEGDLLDIKNDHRAANDEKVREARSKVMDIERAIKDDEQAIAQYSRRIKSNSDEITSLLNTMDRLRNEWRQENEKEFTFKQEDSCPSCGQALPEEKLQAARDKALEKFNLEKAEKLQAISESGSRKKAEAEELQKTNEDFEQEIASFNDSIEAKRADLQQAQVELESVSASVSDIDSNKKYVAKKEEAKKIEQKMDDLRLSVKEEIAKVQETIRGYREQITRLEQDVVKINQHKLSQNRIQELLDQERQLSDEFDQLEEQLYLIEEFTRSKVSLLEKKINNQFQYARFKLFKEQVNGGLDDACETLYKGVPYSSGLNNAARINVGLDIINTLSEHYGFSAPIFIDNAEAVTQLIDTKAQTISLVVSDQDKVLRVKHSKELELV